MPVPPGAAGVGVHTLEIRAGDVRRIAQELTKPSLDPQTLTPVPSDPVLLERWTELQSLTADAVANRRPRTTEPEASRYLAAVITHHSHWWHALEHHVDQAQQFRSDLTDDVASVIGVPLTAALVRRPFLDLVGDAHPFIGWAAHQELVDTMASLDPSVRPERHEETAQLRAFLTCIEAAIERRLDLVTVYR
jgi:hypothetical protein